MRRPGRRPALIVACDDFSRGLFISRSHFSAKPLYVSVLWAIGYTGNFVASIDARFDTLVPYAAQSCLVTAKGARRTFNEETVS